MSQEDVETTWAVQTSITVSTKADHRSLEERIMVRFPALFRLLALAWSRLSPDSWLRQRLIPYLLGRGYEAANRRLRGSPPAFRSRDRVSVRRQRR
jgi:hypothetical protein